MTKTTTSCDQATAGTVAGSSLYQVVYLSAATVRFTKAELLALLEQSRQKNASRGISGLLLYHDGDFMQLLEGEEAQVRALYVRILLIAGPVAERTFPDWSMGFRELSSPEVKAMPGYSEFLNPGTRGSAFPTDPSRALKLLRLFREQLR